MSDFDVIVIGAGPAGAIASAQLVRAGYRVRVLERQRFPRFSIGESLLAHSLELIEKAGMLDAVLCAGFQFKNGAAFARGDQRSNFNFADKSCPGHGYAFQVQRASFDKLLADEAERIGVRIDYETEVCAADVSGEGPVLVSRDSSGTEETHRPRFVLDASGFGRSLPRLLKLDRPSEFPARAALFTHVEDRIESGAFDRQKILVSIHPRHPGIWYWLIPFSNGRSSVGVVALEGELDLHGEKPHERLWALVAEEPTFDAVLKKARPVARVSQISSYASAVSSLYGPGFALLGNAGEFLDPVFSSGVTIAIKSAHLAAAVVDRQLSGENPDWDAEFVRPLMLGVETFRSFVKGWYDGSLHDVIFHERQDPAIRRQICSVLAGYAWDEANPFVGPHGSRRLSALAAICKNENAN